MPVHALAIDAVPGAPPPPRSHRLRIHANPARTPEVILKQAAAVKLKVGGATYDDIARVLGYRGRSGAHAAVRAGLVEALHDAGTEELRRLEYERLECLHLGRWQRALDGDDEALDQVLRLMVRRAALMGLDAPARRPHAGASPPPFVVARREAELAVLGRLGGLSDPDLAELRDLCDRLAGRREAEAGGGS
jgi:hypothetical protein